MIIVVQLMTLARDRLLICYCLDKSATRIVPILDRVNATSSVLCRLLCIHTIEGGHNSGRSTILLAETDAEKTEWVEFLKSQAKMAVEEANRPEDLGFIRNLQRTCREIYNSNLAQYSIGLVTPFLSGSLRAWFLTSELRGGVAYLMIHGIPCASPQRRSHVTWHLLCK